MEKTLPQTYQACLLHGTEVVQNNVDFKVLVNMKSLIYNVV